MDFDTILLYGIVIVIILGILAEVITAIHRFLRSTKITVLKCGPEHRNALETIFSLIDPIPLPEEIKDDVKNALSETIRHERFTTIIIDTFQEEILFWRVQGNAAHVVCITLIYESQDFVDALKAHLTEIVGKTKKQIIKDILQADAFRIFEAKEA